MLVARRRGVRRIRRRLIKRGNCGIRPQARCPRDAGSKCETTKNVSHAVDFVTAKKTPVQATAVTAACTTSQSSSSH